MSVLDELYAFAHQNSTYGIVGILLLSLYVVYLYYFKYHVVIMKGDYDTRLKKIGRTIPPFPNGWYIVCKSKDLKTGESIAIDQSGHNVTVFRNK